MRKRHEEEALKKMASGDTPLNTVQALKKRQIEGGQAFVVLDNKTQVGPQTT